MAIFYKHLKGTTNATANDTGLWTWLKWSIDDPNKNLNNFDMSKSPEIWYTKGNNDPQLPNNTGYNLGHILTSNAKNQRINESLYCKRLIWPGPNDKEPYSLEEKSQTVRWGSRNNFISIYENPNTSNTPNGSILLKIAGLAPDSKDNVTSIQLTSSADESDPGVSIITKAFKIYRTQSDPNPQFKIQEESYKDDKLNTHYETNMYLSKGHFIVGNTQSATKGMSYVQAPYFNATSDVRAKENLLPLSTNALDIIKKVQVYTFNYKNNPEERTIGVIAQEFLDKKLDNVSLVANEGASGENGDYMSIKETKLIYLLLKGIQEQQAEIDDLKQQIKKLESK